MSRRGAAKLETDMFPFLSVLCSIIGVLMLFLLLIIATRVVAVEQPAAVATAPPPAPPAPPPVRLQAGLSETEYDRLGRRIAELTVILAERQQELASFRSTVIKAEDMIASKEDEVLRPAGGAGKVVGVELDMPVPVEVRMVQGPKTSKKHVFVEVKAEGYVVHDGQVTKGRPYAVGELGQARSPLQTYLAAMDKRAAKEYLVFLIHPNGTAALRKIQEYLCNTFPHRDPELKANGFSRIETGVEPFSPGWLLVKPKSAPPSASAK
jgi:hypothetical protein